MKYLISLVLAFVALPSVATTFHPAAELTRQTALPRAAVDAALAHCDVNQANMNLCARRDQIKAEHALHVLAAQKHSACPHCQAFTQPAMARWRKQRDQACAASSRKQWGDGSMRPAALSMCITAATRAKLRSMKHVRCHTSDHS